MEDLNAWLKRDTDKIFDDLVKMRQITNKCEETVRYYTQIVERLQASEDRNDEFMQKLLTETATLQITKLDVERYEVDYKNFEGRLNDFDKFHRENHVHYI